MTVSFDLDETLFIDPEKISAEPELRFPLNRIYKDRLRAGTVELLCGLNRDNIQVWIYTTSYRSERYIKHLFAHYGIKIDKIINGQRHMSEIQGDRPYTMPSKYPSRYRIDLHVDDEISVYQNGIAYGFRVYLIKENDAHWVTKIRKEIERIRANKLS